MKYWPAALKWGAAAFAGLISICFIYGLFNRFEFWHAASPPGLDSGIAYAWFAGFIVGPYVFTLGAIIGSVRVWRRKRRERLK